MTLDFSRIASAIDIQRMNIAHAAVFGVGGSAGFTNNLVRCGIGRLTLVDPDQVSPSNMSRQSHDAEFIGISKVDAVAVAARRTNPNVNVCALERNFLEMTDAEIDEAFGDVGLLVFATDRFAAQSRGNEIALRLGIPAIWVGLYPGGQAGGVIWWHPEIAACFRCLCSLRSISESEELGHEP